MITLEQTLDMSLVKNIVAEPSIWERFSDGVDIDCYFPLETELWLLVKDSDTNIGVIGFTSETSVCIELHPYIMKKHRRHCREMMRVFFQWFLDNTPDSCIKINIAIPSCFTSTINFARKVGFTDEGVSRDSYSYDGKVIDRALLGITRKEVLNDQVN